MENKLHVSDLTISFRTANGKVQAVRDISFDLNKGETLAIVGESGSGKSVTCKAILGILAGNSIVEGGEIIYDGKDLLKISEEDFHNIRGDKIAMIFQDPMSSLNPIVRIGRQLTEAMILKGKARQRESRGNFNTYLRHLKLNIKAALLAEGRDEDAKVEQMCRDFDTFERCHIKLERAYNAAYEAALGVVDSIGDLAFEMEKKQVKDMPYRIKRLVRESRLAIHEYVVKDKARRLTELTENLPKDADAARKNGNDFSDVIRRLDEIKAILSEALGFTKPDFFAMGYYQSFAGSELPEASSIEKLNGILHDYIGKNFMDTFTQYAVKGMRFAYERSEEAIGKAVEVLKDNLSTFRGEGMLDRKTSKAVLKTMAQAVKNTINPLQIIKDSLSFTFEPGVNGELERYFNGIVKNRREMKRHDRLQRRHDRMAKRGKVHDWKVPEASVTDLELTKGNIAHMIDRLIGHYSESRSHDFEDLTNAAIEYLEENASGVVNKVTKKVAKLKAIKLMEEVGIAEPRRRYNQYPFEFSGGMRQRIVIAIALAANPDILICDEPTTALDVTIQSQILELINKLKEERKLSVIFITHDLGVVANMADRIAVMYAGKIVEYGTSEDLFYHSAHPYTWALLASMPDLDTNERLEAIPGTPPNMIYPPKGDAFAPRNKYAMKIDFERQPPFFKLSDTHYAATWLLHPDAPKVQPPKIIRDRISRMQNEREARDGE